MKILNQTNMSSQSIDQNFLSLKLDSDINEIAPMISTQFLQVAIKQRNQLKKQQEVDHSSQEPFSQAMDDIYFKKNITTQESKQLSNASSNIVQKKHKFHKFKEISELNNYCSEQEINQLKPQFKTSHGNHFQQKNQVRSLNQRRKEAEEQKDKCEDVIIFGSSQSEQESLGIKFDPMKSQKQFLVLSESEDEKENKAQYADIVQNPLEQMQSSIGVTQLIKETKKSISSRSQNQKLMKQIDKRISIQQKQQESLETFFEPKLQARHQNKIKQVRSTTHLTKDKNIQSKAKRRQVQMTLGYSGDSDINSSSNNQASNNQNSNNQISKINPRAKPKSKNNSKTQVARKGYTQLFPVSNFLQKSNDQQRVKRVHRLDKKFDCKQCNELYRTLNGEITIKDVRKLCGKH